MTATTQLSTTHIALRETTNTTATDTDSDRAMRQKRNSDSDSHVSQMPVKKQCFWPTTPKLQPRLEKNGIRRETCKKLLESIFRGKKVDKSTQEAAATMQMEQCMQEYNEKLRKHTEQQDCQADIDVVNSLFCVLNNSRLKYLPATHQDEPYKLYKYQTHPTLEIRCKLKDKYIQRGVVIFGCEYQNPTYEILFKVYDRYENEFDIAMVILKNYKSVTLTELIDLVSQTEHVYVHTHDDETIVKKFEILLRQQLLNMECLAQLLVQKQDYDVKDLLLDSGNTQDISRHEEAKDDVNNLCCELKLYYQPNFI